MKCEEVAMVPKLRGGLRVFVVAMAVIAVSLLGGLVVVAFAPLFQDAPAPVIVVGVAWLRGLVGLAALAVLGISRSRLR
jgi:hypothetical protein